MRQRRKLWRYQDRGASGSSFFRACRDSAASVPGWKPLSFAFGFPPQFGYERFGVPDLWKFRCARKPFESGCEDHTGFHIAVRRSIERRQAEGSSQLEALRLLALRDGDGGMKRFFDRRSIGRIAFEQDLAADAVQLRLVPALAGAFEGFAAILPMVASWLAQDS
jgi:hypothetical protein